MKPAGNDTDVLQFPNEDGSEGPIIGVLLAADFTAEHESGIRGILSTLNIQPDGRMFTGRSMQAPCTRFATKSFDRKMSYFPMNEKPIRGRSERPLLLTELNYQDEVSAHDLTLRHRLEDDITGRWSGHGFAITAWTDRGREAVRLIEEGIRLGDLAVWTGGAPNNPFARPGLVIVRASLVPQAYRDILDKADQAAIDLDIVAKATGIYDKIEAANGPKVAFQRPAFGYFALAPQMLDDEQQAKLETAHPVRFFLNPMNQTRYASGWYTVEQLELWLNGQGPIIKAAA